MTSIYPVRLSSSAAHPPSSNFQGLSSDYINSQEKPRMNLLVLRYWGMMSRNISLLPFSLIFALLHISVVVGNESGLYPGFANRFKYVLTPPRNSVQQNGSISKVIQSRQIQCPGQYNFGIDFVNVVHHRSAMRDTVYISISLATPKATYNYTQYYGKHGNGQIDAGLAFLNVPLGYNEQAVFTYTIVNNGHASQDQVSQTLEQAAFTVAETGINIAVESVIDVISAIGKVVGTVLGDIIGWLVDSIGNSIEEIVQHGCDGYLGVGYHAFTGENICMQEIPTLGVDINLGTGVPVQKLFGFIPGIICSLKTSEYNVSWYVQDMVE